MVIISVTHITSRGESILDDPNAARSDAAPGSPSGDPAGGQSKSQSSSTGTAPKGIREQLSATIEAALRVGRAHVGLAKAELGEIAAEGKRLGVLAGIAFGLLFFAGLLRAGRPDPVPR